MTVDITVPALGESVTEATVMRWLKAPGDAVATDEPLVELETDKVAVEVTAEAAGTLAEITAAEGTDVAVGALLGRLAPESSVALGTVPARESSNALGTVPARATVPARNPSSGRQSSAGRETVPARESSDALGTVPARATVPAREPSSGRASSGRETVPARATVPAPEPSSGRQSSAAHGTVPARAVPPPSPAVRRLLEEHGLDPSEIAGSGRDGRLLKSDVLAAVVARASAAAKPASAPDRPPAAAPAPAPESEPSPEPAPPAAPAPAPPGSAAAPPAPGRGQERREERVPMSRLRRRAAERLKLALDTAAMLTTFNEVDMSAVAALRAAHGEAFERRHGVRLGLMSFFVHATVAALVEYPAVNAQIEGDDIVYKHHHDIGVAVSAPRGLVVPVLRDAGRMGFAEVEQAIRAYAAKARDNKLALDDLIGGTFTISNGGVFGSLMSTPIINPPQSAILGMHKVQERPVAVAGAVEIRPMMYLALSYDHRLIDGREAVSFLVRVKDCIEDPQRILLDL